MGTTVIADFRDVIPNLTMTEVETTPECGMQVVTMRLQALDTGDTTNRNVIHR